MAFGELEDKLYSESVRQIYTKLSDDDNSFDICISVGCKEFKAHRSVLSQWSGYFKTLFMKNVEGKHSLEQQDGVSPETFGLLKDWIYRGRLPLTKEIVNSVLLCAHKLEVSSAVQFCVKFIKELYEHNDKDLVTMLENAVLAERLGIPEFQDIACRKILEDFQVIAHTETFLNNVDLDLMRYLLKQDDLDVSENKLLSILMTWLHHKEDRMENADSLIKCIRLGLVDSSTLIKQVNFKDCTLSQELKSLVQNMVLRELNPQIQEQLEKEQPELFVQRCCSAATVPTFWDLYPQVV